MTERLWLGQVYFPLLLGILVAALATHWYVAGAAVLICTAIWFMLLCSDILASFCPLLLAAFLVAPEYVNMIIFLPCLPLLFLFVAAAVLHFVIWPVPIRLGRSSHGLAMVSAAAILSGCDSLPLSARTAPLTLYYTLGLGAGALVIYAAVRSVLAEKRSYDLKVRFAQIWLTAGLGMAAVVAAVCWQHLGDFAALNGAIPEFKCRNFSTTILLTTLPSAFYLSRRNRWYLAAGAVMVVAMIFTGSRSALLFGTALSVLGCVYLVRFGAVSLRTMGLVLAAGAVFMALFGVEALKTLYESRLVEGRLIVNDSLRWHLLAQSVEDYLNHPVFGVGLGNTANSNLFTGVPGSMFFYHCLPAQAAGSMGILGIAAYAVLIGDRVQILFRGRKDPFVVMLALSYAGMLLVSLTNPGEFCPFPNEVMMVTLFAVAECHVGDRTVLLEQLLPRPSTARIVRSK
ncbi:MAG: O-antigen ligase family protein [Oscillospiraceae bacterium]|nr:O-antigen ligase family protein [Oscillospiraceae bacterium]